MARPIKHDGGLYKRTESTVWWMQYRDKTGQRQRESTGTEDWDEAQTHPQRALASQRQQHSALAAPRAGDSHFGEWADFYLENFSTPPFRAPKTHEVNQRAMKHLRAVFENTRLADLTADDIETYLRERLKQRVQVKTGKGIRREEPAEGNNGSSGISGVAADAERGGAQEVSGCESMRGRGVSGAGRWPVPAALHGVVRAAEDRVRRARVSARTSSGSSRRPGSGFTRS